MQFAVALPWWGYGLAFGAAGAVAADQGTEQRLAHLVRLLGQRTGAELQHCGRYSLG